MLIQDTGIVQDADTNAPGGEYGNTLQAASREGHNKAVQMLLNKGADVNAQDGEYGNALQAASSGGHDQVVQMLLDKGADVDRRGADVQITEEVVEAAAGNWENGTEVMTLLLDQRGADILITEEVVRAAAGNSVSGK